MVEKQGNELYRLLVDLAGLEHEDAERELGVLMKNLGLTPDTLTTENIRQLMALYLDEFHTRYADSLTISPPSHEPVIMSEAEA